MMGQNDIEKDLNQQNTELTEEELRENLRKLDETLQKCVQKLEEMQEKLLRQMAEFDNYRKRTEKEKTAMYDVGAKDVVEKLLPVIDNFERGFSTVAEEDKGDAFVSGMQMVYKQLMTTLEGIGVKPIEAIGKEFNPDYHNAVMHVEDDGVGENVIVEEFQKGYMHKDVVIRYSMVKVAN